MVARKQRTLVVLDTNVLISHFLSRSRKSPNRRIVRRWLMSKQLQLVVSPELLEEYLETFVDAVGMPPDQIERWRRRFEEDSRCTMVNLARRYEASRDPDDNIVLATATAGRAAYLVTNDRDLLDIPEDSRRLLPFAILSPRDFLNEFEDKD